MTSRPRETLSALLLTGALMLAACDGERALVAPDEALLAQHPAGTSAAVSGQIAQLRALTAPFHRIEAAMEAGWDVQITPCLELPGVGGMGYHYGNLAFIDGNVNLLEPELLLYEPTKNGRLRLVGVEYIVPYDFHGPEEAPPTLMGQDFHRVDGAGLWGLHVWIWRHNPLGMFADWNPNVTCEFAS
jgi:hypothetical protein